MNALRSIFLFCFLSILYLTAAAQSRVTDSLKWVINNSTDDKARLEAYRSLTKIFLLKDFDECMTTASNGAVLAEKMKDLTALGELQKSIGISWYFKGSYDSAAVFYYKALEVLKSPNNRSEKADVLIQLGKLYRKTKDLNRAMQMYDEAYAIYKITEDEMNMATILNESGVVFEYKGDYTEALKRYKQSLAIREKKNDTIGKAYSLNFIGGIYTLEKKFAEAENYLSQSLELRKQIRDTFAIALTHADLGYMFAEENKLEKAAEQYELSNTIAIGMKYPELQLENYKELSVIAEKNGNAQLSLDYYKKHIALKDSIFSNEKMKQIEQLNAKYQVEKKEQQLKLQNAEITKKNYLLWGLAAIFVMLVLSGFAFYRKRRIQHELNLQSTVMKQQDIATKAIISAEENERKRIAADLHDGIGQMMSAAKMNLSAFESEISFKNDSQKNSFDKVISLVDESCKEIRSVSHQMMPNALLKSGLANAVKEFIDKINNRVLKIDLYTEGLNERIDGNVETVLYRVIQECVNNVIKHSGANNLDISLIKDADGIAVTVEDNGRGFDTNNKQNFEGIGLKNISSRVEFLKGTVDFDSSPGKGTLVAIHVPLV